MSQGTVGSIHVAPGSKGDGEPITSVDEVRAVAGKGLEGDRYSGMSEDREVSLIEAEAIEAWRAFVPLAEAVGDRASLDAAPEVLRRARANGDERKPTT